MTVLHFLYTLIIYPLTAIIEVAYQFANRFFHNTGLAVIGVSVAITLLCLPLYTVAEHWQEIERDKQKQMKSGLDRIKKAFLGDERYMMTTTYYKQHHYNPIMALRSSFGLLIQIPFFIAAYHYLSHLDVLKGQSFLFIRDMGAPDALFSIGNWQVNVLPIAMTLINSISGAIYTKGFPLKEKLQLYGMALIFLIVLYPSPSGLVLYWTMNNVFSLIKNIFFKLKQPGKAFWLCMCGLFVLGAIYIFFFSRIKKPVYRIPYVAVTVLLFCLPLILRGIRNLLRGPLAAMTHDKVTRHLLFLLSCLVLFLLSGIVIPSSLIASSPIEFSGIGAHPDPSYYLNNTLLQAAGFFLFWAVCVYFLFRARIQTIFAVGMSFLAFAALVDVYIFMPRYGDISSTLTFLNAVDFRTVSLISLLNTVALIALLVAVIALCRFKTARVLLYGSAIASMSLFALSVHNHATINREYAKYLATGATDATEITPLFHLSKNHRNVILIMLDRAQGQFIDEIMNEQPELRDVFSGFTFYNNVLSFNGHTLQGAPGIYGGYEYTPLEMNRRSDVPLQQKNDEALLLLPRMFTEQQGFTATFTDPSWAKYSHFCDLSLFDPYPAITGYKTLATYNTLWTKEHSGDAFPASTDAILKRNLLFFSFFREVPIGLRELVYKQGTYFSADNAAQDAKVLIDNYAVLDYLLGFTDIAETEGGSYTCLVNELTHESAALQAPDYTPARTVTNYGTSRFSHDGAYHTEMASLKLLGKWFTYFKEQGIYDSTRIVITSDHGCTGYEDDFEEDAELDARVAGKQYSGRGHYHPLLLVKDFNATGALKSDDSFMTNADCVSFLLKDFFDQPVNPFTGKPIPLDTTLLKKDGVYISVNDNHQPEYNGKYQFNIRENEWWHIADNIFLSANWRQESPFADKEQ